MFSKRALIWSGVVVATAIIISFTSPPPPKPNRDLAKLDDLPDGARRRRASRFRRRAEQAFDIGRKLGRPAGQPRKLRTDKMLAKERKPTRRRRRSGPEAKPKRTVSAPKDAVPKQRTDKPTSSGGARSKTACREGRPSRRSARPASRPRKARERTRPPTRRRKRKAAPPIESFADSRPAPVAEPMPASPTPSQPELPKPLRKICAEACR